MALIDRVKCDLSLDDILVWKFPSEELRLGSQLIVNQSQEAVFVKGGKVLDVFLPGTHTLSTGNIPLLNKILDLPFGGQTPFTAEVWYVNRAVKRDLRWGTKAPIQVIDQVYNFPVSVRAFGRWGLRIENSRSCLTQLVGTRALADAQQIHEYFVGEIVQKLGDVLAKFFVDTRMSVFQASARLTDLANTVTAQIIPEFQRFGIEVVNFNIESINIPKEEQQRFQDVLGKRMEIEQVSQATVGSAYTVARTFDALQAAAQTPGGAAGTVMAGSLGLGIGLGAAIPLGKQLGDTMQVSQSDAVRNADDVTTKLQKLKALLDANLITPEDYDRKKGKLLDEL